MLDPRDPDGPALDHGAATRRRRRWSTMALVVGAAVAIGAFADELPEERQIELVIAKPRAVRSLELTWYDGDEVIQRATYRFEQHGAGTPVRTDVRVRPGDYRLVLVLDRDGERVETEHQIHFDDEIASVSVAVR
jgi:hypothetical protein